MPVTRVGRDILGNPVTYTEKSVVKISVFAVICQKIQTNKGSEFMLSITNSELEDENELEKEEVSLD